jgi:hypothetical protein
MIESGKEQQPLFLKQLVNMIFRFILEEKP